MPYWFICRRVSRHYLAKMWCLQLILWICGRRISGYLRLSYTVVHIASMNTSTCPFKLEKKGRGLQVLHCKTYKLCEIHAHLSHLLKIWIHRTFDKSRVDLTGWRTTVEIYELDGFLSEKIFEIIKFVSIIQTKGTKIHVNSISSTKKKDAKKQFLFYRNIMTLYILFHISKLSKFIIIICCNMMGDTWYDCLKVYTCVPLSTRKQKV